MWPRPAHLASVRDDPGRTRRRRSCDHRSRRGLGSEGQRLFVHQVRGGRVLRCDRACPAPLQGGRRPVAATANARDARGPLVDRLGEKVRRDVCRRREGPARRMRTDTRPSIAELEDRIAALPPDARAAAERIFAVSSTVGRLEAPAEMRDWIVRQFGSVDTVTEQKIIRVTNLVMLEGALFNDLRARRPLEVKGADEVRDTIEKSRNDPFCHPETGTPADTFG